MVAGEVSNICPDITTERSSAAAATKDHRQEYLRVSPANRCRVLISVSNRARQASRENRLMANIMAVSCSKTGLEFAPE